jgi:putative N6-adenine-specific DNA methylase
MQITPPRGPARVRRGGAGRTAGGGKRLAPRLAGAHACAVETNDAGALDLYAVTAPGLEEVCAGELRALGIAAAAGSGGVSWRGDARTLWRASLEARTASRIVARVGEFRARTFAELERHAARLPWSRFITVGAPVALRVTCRKSRLYHEGAVAERVARVLADRVGTGVSQDAGEDDEYDAAGRLIIVRLFRDSCTVSADASGALLHQRGYRQALAGAPMRETLAAAMLLATGWRGTTPLIDPLCGSGTIPIEGALLARRIPPGLARTGHVPRRFAFEDWPGVDPAVRDDVVAAARAAILPSAPAPVIGTDRNAGAIAAARANAERAGVRDDIVFERRTISELEPPPENAGETGHLVTNPPYGVRIGDRRELRALYAALGRVAVERLPGWNVALLSADPRLDSATGLSLREVLATSNGGIPVRLVAGVPGTRIA